MHFERKSALLDRKWRCGGDNGRSTIYGSGRGEWGPRKTRASAPSCLPSQQLRAFAPEPLPSGTHELSLPITTQSCPGLRRPPAACPVCSSSPRPPPAGKFSAPPLPIPVFSRGPHQLGPHPGRPCTPPSGNTPPNQEASMLATEHGGSCRAPPARLASRGLPGKGSRTLLTSSAGLTPRLHTGFHTGRTSVGLRSTLRTRRS